MLTLFVFVMFTNNDANSSINSIIGNNVLLKSETRKYTQLYKAIKKEELSGFCKPK